MIDQTSFIGIPLRTQRQRRFLVLGYYLLLAAFAIAGLWRKTFHIGFLLPQIVTFGGLLGGIKIGGPVKYYNPSNRPPIDGSGLESLNLSGHRPFNIWPSTHPLDEREKAQRDAAHFKAYRLLAATFLIAAAIYWLAEPWSDTWIIGRVSFILWLILIYVLSLPQAVLLWTEPKSPTADLIEMPATQTP